ncbi:MAG TPA: hypothetical protein P5531_04670 [Bacteroidales bacterium]|nr:hypothetical protein [Bacteroidales bacterium]HSA42703.1 hypothetical protein [Bacteroidales bacterium]
MNLALIQALDTLGRKIESCCLEYRQDIPDSENEFVGILDEAGSRNAWFTREQSVYALECIAGNLTEEKLCGWLTPYHLPEHGRNKPAKIGVVSAGNIPLAGFHDWLCVMLTGHVYIGKLSTQDKVFLPWLHRLLADIYPPVAQQVLFTDERLSGTDAVIASGSNNTFRYFEYYFRHIPSLLRKNRNGAALLDGGESDVELGLLGEDVFRYFGLGCRSVSKLFVPEGFEFDRLFRVWEPFGSVLMHHKYRNNYDYFKSVYLVNRDEHLDNGFILLRPAVQTASPVAVLFFETYPDQETARARLAEARDQIQCIAARDLRFPGAISFGHSQKPALGDYADGIDTIAFLNNL